MFKELDYFAEADIVVLAESYHGTHFDMIMELVSAYSCRLAGILWEQPVSDQFAIDEYMQTRYVNTRLESFFAGALREGKDERGMLAILESCALSRIPAICIDSSKIQTEEYKTPSKHGKYFLRGESRDEDMAHNIVRRMETCPGKYFAVVGAAHIESGKHFRTGLDTLGTRLRSSFERKYQSVLMLSTKGNSYLPRDGFDHIQQVR